MPGKGIIIVKASKAGEMEQSADLVRQAAMKHSKPNGNKSGQKKEEEGRG